MSIWNLIKSIQEKYNLVQWLIMTLIFLGGLTFNAVTNITAWFTMPYENSRNITILLEKSEETSSFIESLKAAQRDFQQDQKDFRTESKEHSEDLLELRAAIRRLEDGQIQLFLKTERLDERTQRNPGSRGGNSPCGDQC